MSRVTGFHHVSVLVRDTQRALGFYQGVLGLAIAQRSALGFAGVWLELGGGQQLHLLEVPGARAPDEHRHGGRDYHFALLVADLDAVVAALEAAGIAYTLSRSGRRALFCRDPDGNAVELVEQALS